MNKYKKHFNVNILCILHCILLYNFNLYSLHEKHSLLDFKRNIQQFALFRIRKFV